MQKKKKNKKNLLVYVLSYLSVRIDISIVLYYCKVCVKIILMSNINDNSNNDIDSKNNVKQTISNIVKQPNRADSTL